MPDMNNEAQRFIYLCYQSVHFYGMYHGTCLKYHSYGCRKFLLHF